MTLQNTMWTVVSLLLVGLSSEMVSGQELCSCSPSTYEFTFDFSLDCPRATNDYPDGISEVTCFITSFSADVEDLTPIAVQSISVIEADVDRIPIAQSQIEGEFVTGDTFTYSSISALGNSTQTPQSIQLTITGTNAGNSSLVQVWAIKFTNDCDVFPVLEEGESFGWTEFSDLGLPRSEVCPAAPLSTFAPTMPEVAPTMEPTIEGTDPVPAVPTIEPMEPTAEPVEPTTEPTVSEIVTDAPTNRPKKTPEPTLVATDMPTIRPTFLPTALPSIVETSPVVDESPTLEPTTTPPPTKSPKGGGKEPDPTSPPTLLPTMKVVTKTPTIQPTVTPATPSPTKRPSLSPEETESPSLAMSFSYDYDLDYEVDMEWGRGDDSEDSDEDDKKSAKKTKKAKNSDDGRGRVRIGQRRIRH
ncbi:ECF subfamily RNA polymerase sigma-24 subunit [Seminavis robusta]|uniref:ECF subfamily RNA polymerase sigma-24 subunit n=2 Tax=Seminavis robusta TaxID=568900 RepID=A0A9N8EUZ9_9STRA|nr:ECF subfamily RNA polymerase sigma-24 subunit [Seminavis robusta]|eukprot:Sro1957_g307830.1 ECF subfamily RNA polymerase sigma-24 subunit (415) ;mRNA; r:18645-19978